MDLKQDLRCDTIDTREEYEMKVRTGEGPPGGARDMDRRPQGWAERRGGQVCGGRVRRLLREQRR